MKGFNKVRGEVGFDGVNRLWATAGVVKREISLCVSHTKNIMTGMSPWAILLCEFLYFIQ